jgi:hypothetical protein
MRGLQRKLSAGSYATAWVSIVTEAGSSTSSAPQAAMMSRSISSAMFTSANEARPSRVKVLSGASVALTSNRPLGRSMIW